MFTLPYLSARQQFSGWFVFLKGRWATDTFVTNYLPMVMLPVLYVGAKWYKRTPLVPYAEMDFKSGLQEVLDASYVFLRCPVGVALPDHRLVYLALTRRRRRGTGRRGRGAGW